MRTVISDSSTLIHLAKIGRLNLLRKLFGRIVITPRVWIEVVEQGSGRAGATEVEVACADGWIEIIAPVDAMILPLLKRDLDEGEAEVIALAIECKADMVLLDEWEARRIAEVYNLVKTGIIGVLLRGKQEGYIGFLKSELDKLRDPGGFWIDEELYRRALTAAGEDGE